MGRTNKLYVDRHKTRQSGAMVDAALSRLKTSTVERSLKDNRAKHIDTTDVHDDVTRVPQYRKQRQEVFKPSPFLSFLCVEWCPTCRG